MPLFKIKTHSLKNYSVPTEKFSNTAVVAFAQTLTPKVRLANVANSAFTILDDTAVNIGGGYIVLTGSDFVSGAQVLVGNTPATSTSFVNSSILQVQVPARPAGTYNVFVVNPDGGTGIRVNGVTYSTFPAFSTGTTLTSQTSGAAFGLSISATSDSNVTYSNTSALPAGTTLLANGWFYGANSVATDTTYSFTVKATDAENQDTDRTFSLSIIIPFKLWMWGRGSQGQLGIESLGNANSPIQVGTGTDWNQISSGAFATILATKQNGTLWTWGGNTNGQLGQNDTIARSSPAQQGASTNWNRVSAGQTNAMATKTDGTLWTWGQGTFGAHGLNQSTPYARSNPIQIGTSTNWNLINTVQYTRMATKTDGTLWSWGYNHVGQLGLNDAANRSSPTQVGVATNWSLMSTWNYNTLAIKTDGTLWAWGNNNNGQLGLNDRVSRSSPTQVGVATNWSQIGAGQACLATKTDGTLWLWGGNSYGQLGLNDRVNRSSPVQIGSSTNWSQVDARNGNNMMATKTDGTLWLWGANFYGRLGLGLATTTHRSSPSQVGTRTAWTLLSGGGYTSMAINRS